MKSNAYKKIIRSSIVCSTTNIISMVVLGYVKFNVRKIIVLMLLLPTILISSNSMANIYSYRNEYISNGEDAGKNDLPQFVSISFQTTIRDGYFKICGGTLISASYVVTAAHCFGDEAIDIELPAEDKSVRLKISDYDDSQPSTIRYAARVISHPDYIKPDNYNTENDILLIKLQNPVDNISPIKIPPYRISSGKYIGEIYGFGKTSSNDPTPPKKLQKTNVFIRSYNISDNPEYGSCINKPNQMTVLNKKNELCVSSQSDQNISNALQGDSGGPLIYTRGNSKYLIGVTSRLTRDYNDPESNKEVIYTRLYPYSDWIKRIIN